MRSGASFSEREQQRLNSREHVRRGRDHRCRAYLGADSGQALRRQGRVKRQVAAARLHDGEDGLNPVDAPLQVDAGHRLRTHADLDEVVREPTGRLVKLTVGHSCPADHDGERAGTPGCLLRDEFVNEPAPVRAERRAGSGGSGGDHVLPGAFDVGQALALGHDGGSAVPPRRHVELHLPERVLTQVVDHDNKVIWCLSRVIHAGHESFPI